jgi:2-polyprenyl-3-methyl-5-hydroxy-6-metoxy-1,4-benzoquinol methylase
MEELQHCPSCGNSGFNPYLTCTDFTYSQDPFHIVECGSCRLRFTNPRPAQEEIGRYYDSAEYVSHNDTDSGLMFTVYQAVKRFTLKGKTKLVKSFCSDVNALDYGAGTGDFANAIQQSGFNTSAFEPDGNARNLIKKKYPHLNVIDSFDALPNASLQIITLWHVLEHVHALRETLERFHKKLDADGTLIIAVPNCDSFDASHYGEHWAAYDVPRHLYHFTPKTISTLLHSSGFKLIGMKPMWFDSFYVSLLSEQYRNPSGSVVRKAINTLSAVIMGALSNFYSINDKKRCSSIIYILKKQ